MATEEVKYVVDTEEAVRAIAELSDEYKKNAEALGTLYKEYGSAINEGQKLISSFTQITEEGKAVTTTIHTTEEGVKNLKVEVVAATAAQLKFIQRQKEMAAVLADANANFQPIKLSQENKADLINQFGKTGQALRRAIRDANELGLAIAKGNAALARLGATGQQADLAGPVTAARQAMDRLLERTRGVAEGFDRIRNIGIATGVYRALSAIGQGVKQSINDAAEFEREIALIQTLAQDSGETFNSWATSVRKVSDELGLPIVDVATAAYEGLSNQVIHTTRDFDVLKASLSLAKTTKSDSVTSLNVISAVINGFGKSAEEAGRIADKLFTTVDLGNVKLEELATTIGRGSALSKQANVSLEELFAGIAVITQSGVSSAEAVTLLNNVFVQLSKPSEALRKKLLELNFATGQQATSTLGLIGLLIKLSQVSKDVPNGLAGLFPDIRGLRGAESLSGDASGKFIDALDKITNSLGNNAKALKIVQENAGGKLAAELERLKNVFTVDIGTKFLETVVSATEQFGGLSVVLKNVSLTLVTAAGAALAFKTSLTVISTVNDLRTVYKTYQGLGGILKEIKGVAEGTTAATVILGEEGLKAGLKFRELAIAGGLFAISYFAVDSAIKFVRAKLKEEADREINEAKKVAEARIAAVKEANAKILESFDKSIQDQTRKFGAFVAAQQELVTGGLKQINKETDSLASKLQNRFDLLLGVLKGNVSDVESSQKKALDAIKDIREAQTKTAIEQTEQLFDRNIKLAELERDRFIAATGNKQAAYQQYIRRIAALNEQRITQTKQQQQVALSKNDIGTAERLNSEIRNILNSMQDMTVEVGNVTRPLFDQQAIQNRISSEAQQFNKLLADRVPLLEAQAAKEGALAFKEKERVKELEDLLKTTAKFSETVVKDGAFTPEFVKDPKRAFDELDKLQAKARGFVNQVGGLNNKQTLANLGVSKDELDKLFKEQQKNLGEQINFAAQQKTLRDLSDSQKAFTDQSRNGIESVNKKIVEQTALYETTRQKIIELSNTLRDEFFKRNDTTGQQRDQINATIESIKGDLAIRDVAPAANKLVELQGQLGNGLVKDPFGTGELIKGAEAASKLKPLVAEMAAINPQGLVELRNALDSMSKVDPTNLQEAEQAFLNINKIAPQFPGIPGLDEAEKKLFRVINLIKYMQQLQNSQFVGPPDLRGKSELNAGGGVVGSAGGFMTDFLGGRFRKGTDVVPTMLSRGERVIRQPMAEKHAALLNAINGNRVPKSTGGSMVNQSIGDININMPNGTTNRQVRALGAAINRAIKQGTMSIGN